MTVEQALAENAVHMAAQFDFADSVPGDLAHQFAKKSVQRRNGLAHDLVQRGRGIGQFARHDPALRGWVLFIQQHHHEIADEQAQAQPRAFAGLDVGILHLGKRCKVQRFGEQPVLAAKVIIHCRDICTGPAAYLSDGRALKTMLRKYFARRFQQTRARQFAGSPGFCSMRHLPATSCAVWPSASLLSPASAL